MPRARPRLVAVDTETTGLDPASDRVIDIGAVALDARLQPGPTYTTLVDPGAPVPLYVTRLTGIDERQLAAAPGFADAFLGLRDFVGDAILLGHNDAFDRDHLAAGARRAGLPPLENEWFDTLDAALLLYPELDRHSLPLLAEALGIETDAHRALPDARTTATVFARLASRAAGLGAEERRLLESVSWPPLRLLDACAAKPDEAPPPVVPGDLRGATQLSALPVDPDGWRSELEWPGQAQPVPERDGGEEEADGGAEAGAPGLASRLPGFRHRPGQVAYAAAAAETFARGGVGVFEAGTGMGKSLAYLLPAAFAGAAEGRRVVVSTKTKALQRQLAAHELPLVAAALPDGWRWALLMGRENYLCRRRLDEALEAESAALPDPDRAAALAYLVGRSRRGEVDLSALPYRATQVLPGLAGLARDLRSSRATCLGRYCPQRRTCHWRLARSQAEAAHLVCVNHALLLTGPDTLPAYEDVVIDEAHLLYQEATEAFSDEVDAVALELLLADVRGRGRQRGLPQRLRAAARGLDLDAARVIARAADACDEAAADLPELSKAVGAALGALAAAAVAGEEGSADGAAADAYNQTVWITPGLREFSEFDVFATGASLLAEGLAALASAAASAAEALPEDHREHAPAAALAADAETCAALLSELPEGGSADTVVWAEIESAGRSASGAARWTLTRSPVTPGRRIKEALWERLRSAVLTSATLTVAGSFAYFRDMTGLDGDVDVREAVFASPFDFRRQAVLVLERDPAGAWRPSELAGRQGERLKSISDVTGGRTLVLYTNKRDMHRVAATVGGHVEDEGVLVLAQGVHGSAASLAEEFRSDPRTILFGVDTLWTGQDFPGDALTCLVIAKLPFPRQGPLFEARRRACDEAGERWFDRFYLPEAVLKFRQGFGRLIRTESDTGVVVVLDHRLATARYRDAFLRSLPELEVVEAAPDELAAVVDYHLRRLTAGP